jgi:predicted esterase
MRTRISSFLFADYFLQAPLHSQRMAKRLVVLLHGYEQSGEKMMEKLRDVLPSDAAILAPNGPFPLPRRTDSGYRIGFSWYFWNPITNEYFIDMEIGVSFIRELVSSLGLGALPTTLIGFSQGGYLSPFLAEAMPQVDHVIGLGCEFLTDEIKLPVKYRVDAVHGALDDVVSAEGAKKAHEALLKSGASGEFQLLSESGHRIDAAMKAAIADLLNRR